MNKDSPTGLKWAHKRKSLETDGGFPDCPYCETPFYYADGELDHIRPRSLGGNNRKKNLVLVCRECNRAKRNAPLHIYLYRIGVSPEKVYFKLKKMGKRIPCDMLDFLGFDD